MKVLAAVLLLSIGFWERFTQISSVNAWQQEARLACQRHDYGLAAALYRKILAGNPGNVAATRLNLAHCLRLSRQPAASAQSTLR